MDNNNNKTSYNYVTVGIIAIILLILPINKQKRNTDFFAPPIYAGDSLQCYIMIDKSLAAKGNPLGYIYKILDEFEKGQGCNIERYHEQGDPIPDWIKLTHGEIDMVIINSIKDTVPTIFQESLISSLPINSNEDIIVTNKDNYQLIQTFNYWLTYFKQTEEYENIIKKYFRRIRYGISPYDSYVKEYSTLVGWDWRLVSSLIYQESKFKIGLSSSKGAIGLMQIKENVAKSFGIDDIYDPESNIKAGILHLQRLQNMYKKMGIQSDNLTKITLAAYNAGEGRIEDAMSLTKALGKDPLIWENLAATIPLLWDKDYYTNPAVKYGRFKGTETIKFVDEILARYDKYSQSIV